MASARPVVLLAFADDREPGRHLRNLRRERQELERSWRSSGAFEVVVRENATLDDIAGVFQDNRGRVVLFHYAGHAESYGLLLHSAAGESALVGTDLAGFLGRQQGLQFVFLNACSTAGFVEALISAGVPAVAGTSLDVDDEVATGFAIDFYRGLATDEAIADGATLDRAFADAESLARARLAGAARDAEALAALESLSDEERHIRVAYRTADVVQYRDEATRYVREWPWGLRAADDEGRRWALREAVEDPYFGLPRLPGDIRLPLEPFRYLNWFHRDHARVFFGRGADIRKAYQWVADGDEPLMLLYGQSGVGKSSFLEAGLLPRLEAGHEVRYLRRDPELGLLSTLAADLGCEPGAEAVSKAWRELEEASDRPLVVVLDQVEEAYTVPISGGNEELAELIEGVRGLFGVSSSRPRGRLVFGFRKEWLAEVEGGLDLGHIEWRRFFLQRLDRAGITEVVRGIASTAGLRSRYGLSVDATLPEIIADDLLEDAEAALSPTLQILLTKMWASATEANDDDPEFTKDLYWGLKKQGLLLSDFLDEQLATLATLQPDASESGLDLDVLAFHTTALGTSRKRAASELRTTYSHLPEALPELLQTLESLHLLTRERRSRRDPDSVAYRLAHDTVAPIVRSRFDDSQKAGQRLRRALNARAPDWKDGAEGSLLDERELRQLPVGLRGMRTLSPDEMRLVEGSRARLERDRKSAALSESRALAASGRRSLDVGDLISATALGFGALSRARTDEAQSLVREVLSIPGRCLAIIRGQERAEHAVFSRDGEKVITTGFRGVAHVWSAEAGTHLASVGTETDTFRVAVSPRGDRVLVAGDDGGARLCSVDDGETLAILDEAAPGSTLTRAAISENGDLVFTLWEDEHGLATGEIWSTTLGERVAGLGDPEVTDVALSPRGERWLTSFGLEAVKVWDLAWTREPWASSPWPARPWREGEAEASGPPVAEPRVLTGSRAPFAFGPRGSTFVTAVDGSTQGGAAGLRGRGDRGSEARVWSFSARGDTPDSVTVLTGHGATIRYFAFCPVSPRVISVSDDRTARIWSTSTGHAITVLRGHRRAVTRAAFSEDGEKVVTGGTDKTARVWSAGTGEELVSLRGHDGQVIESSFGPRGNRVVTNSGGVVRVWSVEPSPTSSVVSGSGGGLLRVGLAGANRDLVSMILDDGTLERRGANGDRYGASTLVGHDEGRPALGGALLPGGGAVVWTAEGLFEFGSSGGASFSGRRVEEFSDLVAHVTPGPRSDFLVGGMSGAAAVWSGWEGFSWLLAHNGAVLSSAFMEEGGHVVTVGEDGTIRIWNREGGDPLETLDIPGAPISFAACSSDGRLVLTRSVAGDVVITSTKGGLPVHLRDCGEDIVHASFDVTGDVLVTVGPGGVGRLWDTTSGDRLAVLRQPGEEVRLAAFDPDGRRVVTGCRDGTVRIWSASGESLMVLRGHEDAVSDVTFSDDGATLVTGSHDGTARVWALLDPDELRESVRGALPKGLTEDELPEQLTPEERSELLRGS